MMFFRSVAAVFRGVSAFPELSKRNPFRALFHLMLFCGITACLCSGIQSFFVWKKIGICVDGLQKQFESITVSGNGILPKRSAESSRTFYLPGGLRLDYLTEDSVPVVREMPEWKHHYGIFWVRRGFLIWFRPDPAKESFYLGSLPVPDSRTAMRMMPEVLTFFIPCSVEEVEKSLKKYQTLPEWKGESAEYQFRDLGEMVGIYLYFVFAVAAFFSNFILTLIMVLMFAGMQSLWRAPGLENLGFGGTVALLSYAAFPAVAAGMLLESFSFRGLAEILFFILFFIYQLLAFNEVRRSNAGGPSGTQNRL